MDGRHFGNGDLQVFSIDDTAEIPMLGPTLGVDFIEQKMIDKQHASSLSPTRCLSKMFI